MESGKVTNKLSRQDKRYLREAVYQWSVWRGSYHPDDHKEFDGWIAKCNKALKKLGIRKVRIE